MMNVAIGGWGTVSPEASSQFRRGGVCLGGTLGPLQRLGMIGLFLGYVLQGIGVPIPLVLLFALLGKAVSGGAITVLEAIVLAWTGSMTGNVLGYAVGLAGGSGLVRRILSRFDRGRDDGARLVGSLARRGLPAIVVARWVGWGYAQLMWACGAARFPFILFLAYTAVADLSWAAFWTLAGKGIIDWIGHFPRHLLTALRRVM